MAKFKCGICGEKIEEENNVLAKCKFCGFIISTEKADDFFTNIDYICYSRAEKKFSETDYLLNQIEQAYPKESLIPYLKFLSRYGISYVRTPVSPLRVPSFSKTIDFDNFLNDDYLKKAILIETNQEIKDYYLNQANLIADLYTKITMLTKRTNYNDIYISAKRYSEEDPAKRTDEDLTDDYHWAIKTYEFLKEKGYNVFYSGVDAKNTLTENEFTALIHSSIISSKMFILFGENSDYINSAALKDDWYKYIILMKNKLVQNDSLVYIYNDKLNKLPPKLPQELHKFKNINRASNDYFDALENMVKQFVPDNKKTVLIKKVPLNLGKEKFETNNDYIKKNFEKTIIFNEDENKLIEVGLKNLRLKKTDLAKESFEEVLKLNNKNYMGYLGKFLAECGVSSPSYLNQEKLLSVSNFSLLESVLENIDEENGIKLLDKICLSLNNIEEKNVSKSIWLISVILPYLNENQAERLINNVKHIYAKLVENKNYNEACKIFDLITKLSSKEDFVEKSYENFIELLLNKKQYRLAKKYIIDLLKVKNNEMGYLNYLKCQLKLGFISNKFKFKYQAYNDKLKLDKFTPNEIIPNIITYSFYSQNAKCFNELVSIVLDQIELLNFKTADNLITCMLAYMLPLYSYQSVSKFLIQCVNAFNNMKGFEYASKYSKMLLSFNEEDVYAHYEILRTRLKACDDYDMVNYIDTIENLLEFKNVYKIASKNNQGIAKKLELLITHQSGRKEMRTQKAFPRKNHKKINRLKLIKHFNLSIVFCGIIISILIILALI